MIMAVLIIFPVILQTVVSLTMLSVVGQGQTELWIMLIIISSSSSSSSYLM